MIECRCLDEVPKKQQRVWENTEVQVCMNLVDSMPKRLQAVIEAKAPFTPRTITLKITILASTPADDIARASAALNYRARYSRIDSDWMSMFLSFISWKKIVLKVMSTLYRYFCAFTMASHALHTRVYGTSNTGALRIHSDELKNRLLEAGE